MSKKAIVLFNLGGPSSMEEVKPFLFNLFYDKAIIGLINPFRYLLAKYLSWKREEKSKKIYAQIDNKSPILEQTISQAKVIEDKINKISLDSEYKAFVSMRYSKPDSNEVINEILKGGYGEVILLPLYPQFSTTTTESSINEFVKKIPKFYTGKIKAICCYPQSESFIKAHVELIKNVLKKTKNKKVRILFSAHSLPQKIIEKGDPYQWQIESSCQKIMSDEKLAEIEYVVCYQSKVGSLKWLEPSTESEIIRAAQEKRAIVIVPISFVSEHSETLVELDIDYLNLAKENELEDFYRVPALGIKEVFIDGLVEMVEAISNKESVDRFKIYPGKEGQICPASFCRCILKAKTKTICPAVGEQGCKLL